VAFTYSLSTDAGKVRLRISDTNSAAYAFEDDEIAYFLAEALTVLGACRLALQVLLTDAARRSKAFSNPGQSYDDRGRVAAIQQALANLGGDLPTIDIAQSDTLPFDSAYIG
jgi:hypothetical protein